MKAKLVSLALLFALAAHAGSGLTSSTSTSSSKAPPPAPVSRAPTPAPAPAPTVVKQTAPAPVPAQVSKSGLNGSGSRDTVQAIPQTTPPQGATNKALSNEVAKASAILAFDKAKKEREAVDAENKRTANQSQAKDGQKIATHSANQSNNDTKRAQASTSVRDYREEARRSAEAARESAAEARRNAAYAEQWQRAAEWERRNSSPTVIYRPAPVIVTQGQQPVVVQNAPVPVVTTTPQGHPQYIPVSQDENSNGSVGKFFLSLFFILILVGAAFGVYVLWKRKTEAVNHQPNYRL